MLACTSARSAKMTHSRSSSTSVLRRDQQLSAWVVPGRALSSHSPRRLWERTAPCWCNRARQASPLHWPPRSEWTRRSGLGGWAKKARGKAVVTNSSGIVAPMPAHDVRSACVLESAPIGPAASDQGQVRAVGHPDLIGPGELGLVKQAVGGVAQPVSGISRAQGEGLSLQRAQTPAAHGRAQALPAHGGPVLAQRHLQPAGVP